MTKTKPENPTLLPAPAPAPAPVTVTVTGESIKQVQNCIEQCMMRYMTKRQAKEAMQQQHNIDPCLTDIVWDLLEHLHKDFFILYYKKLKAIEMIENFNRALAKHVKATERYGFINGADDSKKPSNGIMEKNKAPLIMPENTQLNFRSIGSSSDPCIQTPIGSSSHGNNTNDFRRASFHGSHMNGIVHSSNVEMPVLYNNSHSNGFRRASLDVTPMNGVIHQSNMGLSRSYISQNGYCQNGYPHNNPSSNGMGYNNGSVYARGPNIGLYKPRNPVHNGNGGYNSLPQDFFDPSPMHENWNQGNTANSSWQQQQSRHDGPGNNFNNNFNR